MPTYPNPAGGSMQAANDADAKSKGWSPSMGSFGINTYPDSSGGGPSTPSAPQTPTTPGGINQAQLDQAKADILGGFKESSGFSREQLAESKRQFDEQMALAERTWVRQGLPQLEIQKRLADLEDEKFKADLEMARANQGLEYLKTSASLVGPADVFQSIDFNRGAQQRGDVPIFLNALQRNTQMPAFQSAGSVPQLPQTAAGIASRLTGGGATTAGGYDPDQALAAIGNILKSGPNQLAPNALEQLNPSEVGVLQSGAKKLGYDWENWIKAYGASRIGQTAGAPI